MTSGVSIPLVTYIQAVREKKKTSLRMLKRERVGGKKEKEILLHKEQV